MEYPHLIHQSDFNLKRKFKYLTMNTLFHCRIFLVDHAWTYKPHEARKHLQQIPGLANRMSKLVEIDDDNQCEEIVVPETIEKILNKLYLYSQTYTVNKDDMVNMLIRHYFEVSRQCKKINHAN